MRRQTPLPAGSREAPNRTTPGFGALLAAAVCLFLITHWAEKKPSPDPPAPRVPVTTAIVEMNDVPIELEAIGRVTALKMVSVQSLVGGQIVANKFKDGQYVHQGDVLVEIDPRPLQATVNQDKANLARDRASLTNAETDLKRYIPLVGNGVVSVQQVTTQRSVVAQLQGTVAADEALLERDQVQLGYTSINAPISGVLGLTLVDPGNIITQNNPATSVVLTRSSRSPFSSHCRRPRCLRFKPGRRRAAAFPPRHGRRMAVAS